MTATPHPYDALLLECAGLRARIAELESARDEAQLHLNVERARAEYLQSECTRRLKRLQALRADIDKLESDLAEARSETIAALKRAVALEAEDEDGA